MTPLFLRLLRWHFAGHTYTRFEVPDGSLTAVDKQCVS